MPPKIVKFEKSCERLYGDMKALDLSKPASKKKFMDLIGTFLKDQPIDKKEVPDTLPIPVDLPELKKKKRATARKPKESENEEGEAVAKKKTVITPEKKPKKSTSAKKAKNA